MLKRRQVSGSGLASFGHVCSVSFVATIDPYHTFGLTGAGRTQSLPWRGLAAPVVWGFNRFRDARYHRLHRFGGFGDLVIQSVSQRENGFATLSARDEPLRFHPA